MKIRDGFLLRQFGEDYIVVAVGEDSGDFNKLITLNSVGAFIYESLQTETTYDDVLKKITDKYDVDEKLAKADLDIFLNNVKKAGLLDG